MTLQAIRSYFEAPLITAMSGLTPAIPCFVENELYSDMDAADEFALIRVNFTELLEPTLQTSFDAIRGVVILEVYVPKGIGPGRAQVAAQVGMQALVQRSVRTLPLPAPQSATVRGSIFNLSADFRPLDGGPHFMSKVTAGFRARVL